MDSIFLLLVLKVFVTFPTTIPACIIIRDCTLLIVIDQGGYYNWNSLKPVLSRSYSKKILWYIFFEQGLFFRAWLRQLSKIVNVKITLQNSPLLWGSCKTTGLLFFNLIIFSDCSFILIALLLHKLCFLFSYKLPSKVAS